MATTLDLEADWWGMCGNTFHEEQKQLVYAKRLGLVADWTVGHPPAFNLDRRCVVDIGGGPVSLLLKAQDKGNSVVIDPCPYPHWVGERYRACGIRLMRMRGEDRWPGRYDEAWVYNVLQHVDDPEQVIANARARAKVVRLFEWVNVPAYPGHPQTLTASELARWLGGDGFVTHIDESGAVGEAFYGVFAGISGLGTSLRAR
jgi:hypothetical protein